MLAKAVMLESQGDVQPAQVAYDQLLPRTRISPGVDRFTRISCFPLIKLNRLSGA